MIKDTSQRMFEHACAFADCADYCIKEPNNIQHRTASHTVTVIVNSAFSCEIFIKLLLFLNGVTLEELKNQKHNLKKSWQKYKEKDNNTAISIEQTLCQLFQSQNEHMFDELLSTISNAFEYWRYIYEKQQGTINLNFLVYFNRILREVCCKQLYDKTWEQYLHPVEYTNK